MPCPHRCCPVPCGGVAVSNVLCRVYRCRRCDIEVWVCRECDYGQVYCAGECSELGRRDSQRRAAARYQSSRRGARRHAARQREWRQRHAQDLYAASKVTHHPCSNRSANYTVLAALESDEQADCDAHENDNNNGAEAGESGQLPAPIVGRCHFCQVRAQLVRRHGTGVASAGAALRRLT